MNVSVPLVVTGEPLTLKMDGADSPTLVTDPPPAVLVIVTAPVLPLTLIPDPAVMLVTPVLVTVIAPPNDTGLPLTLMPVPALTVIAEFWRFAFGIPVGKSATTSDLNVGTTAPPVVGPANTVLADWVINVKSSVPAVVIGELVAGLLKTLVGAVNPTLVTDPPPPVLVMVTAPVLPLTLIPEPAVIDVTPVLVSVNTPPNDTGLPPTLMPVPLTVMLEFWRFALGMPVGKSAMTSDLNVGTAAPPIVGPANTVLVD